MSGLGQIFHPRFNCTFDIVDIPWTQCYNAISLSEIRMGRSYYFHYSIYI